MNKQIMNAICLSMMLVFLTTTLVLADEPATCADSVFGSASAFLSSSKLVVFDCTLYDIHTRISVTNVWLEQQVNGYWLFVKSLTPPSYVATNMMDYGAEVNYSDSIAGSGTFRIGFTVDADGYSISRYSNSRTF